jgi:hypothetical protein
MPDPHAIMDRAAMTVGELKAALATIDDSVSVTALYDRETAEGDVVEVRMEDGQIVVVVE